MANRKSLTQYLILSFKFLKPFYYDPVKIAQLLCVFFQAILYIEHAEHNPTT